MRFFCFRFGIDAEHQPFLYNGGGYKPVHVVVHALSLYSIPKVRRHLYVFQDVFIIYFFRRVSPLSISYFSLFFFFFPVCSLVFRMLGGGDPWELYSESRRQQDQETIYWSTSESDAVVYDPENLHWSSSSLSDYLDEVNQDDNRIARPSANKPTRHTWVWTSDEDSQDESYDDGVSGNDAGYMTETTTDSDSSSDENDESLETKQHLPKSSTEMICMDDEEVIDANDDTRNQVLGESGVLREVPSCSSVQQESANVVEVDVIFHCAHDISVVSMAPNADVVGDDVPSLPGDTDGVVLRSDSLQVCDRVVLGEDVDGFQATQMTADGEDCYRDEVNIISGSYEETTSSTDGILHSKAVKLGLLAAGVGIGAYIVYKLCCKR